MRTGKQKNDGRKDDLDGPSVACTMTGLKDGSSTGTRGLRMDLPDEMEWSEAPSGFAEPNADFIVQATSLSGLAHNLERD